MRDIDIKTRRLLVAVCDLQNIKRAAVQEHIEPSAISKRMDELERHVGKALIRRHGRGIEPTAAGELLYLHAKRILKSLRAADQALAEFDSSGVHV